MAAMKEVFTDLQEQAYKKIKNIGASQETIFSFENLLVNQQQGELNFFDFVEKMAGYAMTIHILSETTGYERERLWDIWYEMAEDAIDDGITELDKEWESFKTTTRERDW